MSGHPSEQVDELRRWYVDHVFSGVTDFDTIVAFDPSTGATLATVPVCSPAVVNAATTRARAAQGPWSRTSGQERGRLMTACADRLAEIGDELALLLALESGKALETESRGEVILVEEIFRYFGGVSHELKGHTTPLGTDVMGFTTRHPHGVVAGIVPWNVPLMFMGYKVAAPLVAGNTAVIKVPEQTSFTLIRVLQELVAILPADVVQFLTGTGDTTGAALVADPHVDTVSFTGSVETGRSVYEAAAKLIRPVTLELGGKSPMIILSDCDIDKAVSGVVKSMRFTRGGQSCTAASRVFVAASMIDEFRVRLAAALDEIVIGVALDPNTHCGPLVSARQRDRVQAYIDTATADGLTVETYGTVADGVDWDGGYYVRPCVVIDPPADHSRHRSACP